MARKGYRIRWPFITAVKTEEAKMGSQPGPYGPLIYSSDQWPGNEQWPDADAPINASTVENNDVTSEIRADATPYVQPNVTAPEDNAEVDASSSLAEAGPNQIEASPGNYTQANTDAPAPNPQIGVPSQNLNPMGL
jgi:hypothetical protein